MRQDFRVTADIRFEIDVSAEDPYDAEIIVERIVHGVFYESFSRASHVTVTVLLA